MSFSSALVSSNKDVYLVRGLSGGRKAWYYVRIPKSRQVLFKGALKSGAFDISEFGAILHSGWGDEPPVHIKNTF